jgi:hypothetical protein
MKRDVIHRSHESHRPLEDAATKRKVRLEVLNPQQWAWRL